MSELPLGWCKATLPMLIGREGIFSDGDWVESKDQDPQGDVRLIQLADVGTGYYVDKSKRFLTSETAKALGCTYLEAGDVLIARMPDPLGRACVFPGDSKRSVTVVDICVVRLGKGGIEARWLMHYMNSPDWRLRLGTLASGSTRQRISRGNLAGVELWIPPIAEQHRIVVQLDTLFARSRTVRASLERMSVLVEKLRQSILVAAFNGDLTHEWRARQMGVGADVEGNPTTNDEWTHELPHGWHWKKLDQIAEVAGGLTKNGSKRESAHQKVPLVSVAAVQLREIKPEAIGSIGILPEDGSRGELRKDDLLLVEGNGSLAHIGRVALWNESVPNARHQNHLIRLRPFQMSPRYLLEWLASPSGRSAIVNEATSAAGLYTLSLSKVGRLPVPVAPLDEQREIVVRVSAALDKLRSFELLLERLSARTVLLETASLMKAFRGELVPQDPNDEPASVLLERIRAEREAFAPVKARRGAKAPAKTRAPKATP